MRFGTPLEVCFNAWIRSLRVEAAAETDVEGPVVATDGEVDCASVRPAR